MIFRVVYQELGGHVHFRIWTGRTLGSLGLTNMNPSIMRLDEFDAFRHIMEAGHGDYSQVLFSNKTDD